MHNLIIILGENFVTSVGAVCVKCDMVETWSLWMVEILTVDQQLDAVFCCVETSGFLSGGTSWLIAAFVFAWVGSVAWFKKKKKKVASGLGSGNIETHVSDLLLSVNLQNWNS